MFHWLPFGFRYQTHFSLFTPFIIYYVFAGCDKLATSFHRCIQTLFLQIGFRRLFYFLPERNIKSTRFKFISARYFVSFFRIFRLSDFEKRNQRDFLLKRNFFEWGRRKMEETFFFFDLSSSQAPTCVNGVRNSLSNLKYLSFRRLCKSVLLSRVTLHDAASESDLWQRYANNIHANMHSPINNKHVSMGFLFPKLLFLPSAVETEQLQHESTSAVQILIKNGKSRLALLTEKQKAISISIDLYLHRQRILSSESFYVLHVYWLELRSERNELFTLTVHTNVIRGNLFSERAKVER